MTLKSASDMPNVLQAREFNAALFGINLALSAMRRAGARDWDEELASLRAIRDRLIHEEDLLLDPGVVPSAFKAES